MRYWAFLFLVLIPLLAEFIRLGRWRRTTPVRVHVHGTRGKTSTVKALAAILRERGVRALAKTTGDAPEYVMPDGSVRPVRRWAPARIQEHVDVLRLAARLRAEVLVVEGMALQPETVFQSEQILRATHAVITNVRPDHPETMGRGRRGVLRTLSLMLPAQGALFTARESGAASLRARAEAAGVRCVVVPAPAGRDQSAHLASMVAAELGYAPTQGADALCVTEPQEPAASDLPSRTFMCEGVTVQFHDLFSANDVVSARLWRLPATSGGDDRLRVAMLATRADRPLRTQSFMEWLTCAPEFDLVAPVGDHVWYAVLRSVLRGGKSDRRVCVVATPWTGPERVLRRLCRLARRTGHSQLVVIGFGNAHGFGERWRTFIERREQS